MLQRCWNAWPSNYTIEVQEWADFLSNLDEKVLIWDGGIIMQESGGDGIAGEMH